MPFFYFQWTPPRTQKVEDHGLTMDEVEYVISHPIETGFSRSSGLPVARGFTHTGRWIVCIYDMLDDITIEPVTAYEPGE